MGMMLPVAWVMEKVAIATNTQPRASVDSIRMAEKKMFFSSEKAIRDLGYKYRPSLEAIQDAATWFQNNGYCKG